MSTNTSLSVLDLIPVSSGATVGEAARNAVDLAQQVERLGYRRLWYAEHHLYPGVIGTSPAVAIALVAGATSTIRLGSAGVQSGHRVPLLAVEEFGLIAALHPGRIDLGIGRSPGRAAPVDAPEGGTELGERITAWLSQGNDAHAEDQYTDNGLLLPRKHDFSSTLPPDLIPHMFSVLQQPGAYVPTYTEQIDEVLALLAGTFTSSYGLPARAVTAETADLQLWILGAFGGESAAVAGSRGLRFVAGYHHSPSTVIDAVEAYRAAFVPSDDVPEPYVAVSADVVVGETDEEARVLASGHGPWVHSVRTGKGAIPYPTPEEAVAFPWTDAARDVVIDRTASQFVGSPATVADGLERLRDATGADELAITTITHDHARRVRSYELLAQEWERRGASGPATGVGSGREVHA
jgi:alkanesulfonate monooxygenase SsuD/methylene tetrahydromethanopterin reductase-like flavin-dependent oxidoreductase (luciferase family)